MADLRVRFEDENNPTYPDSWGWSDEETREYMHKIESADYIVLMAALEHRCCGEWHETGDYLGDIHVSWDDLFPPDGNGSLRVVTLNDIPPASTNYLHHIAADLINEYRANHASAR